MKRILGEQVRRRAAAVSAIKDLFEQAMLNELRKAFPEWLPYLKGLPVLIPSPRRPPDPLILDVNNGDTIYILPVCAYPLEYVMVADELMLRHEPQVVFEGLIKILKDFTDSKTVLSIGRKTFLPWRRRVSLIDREEALRLDTELISWTGQSDRPPPIRRGRICRRTR